METIEGPMVTMIPEPFATSAMKRLVRHVGVGLLRIKATTDEAGGFVMETSDPGALIMALLGVIQDSELDDDLQIQAAVMLARGGAALAPLEAVLPALGAMLKNSDIVWAAETVLEMAAPAPGNEDLCDPPSSARESLGRIAEVYGGTIAEISLRLKGELEW